MKRSNCNSEKKNLNAKVKKPVGFFNFKVRNLTKVNTLNLRHFSLCYFYFSQ